jgi:choline dehydrogenase
VSCAHPESRGTVMARSADPRERPAIDPCYLGSRRDAEVIVSGIRIARRIFAQAALAPHIVRELLPGRTVDTDEALEAYVRQNGHTAFHPAGTCKMGIDAMAVVDPRLRVQGVDGLRVIDASVMPMVTTGNINAPTMMIGEKGAAMVVEDRS